MGLQSRSTRSRVKMMSRVALLLPLIAAASAAPEARFSCEECVREMHGLAAMVKMGAIPIHDYIRDNYCPSLDSTAAQHFCEDSLQVLRRDAVRRRGALLRRRSSPRLPDLRYLLGQ